jgi:hypothetical protein
VQTEAGARGGGRQEELPGLLSWRHSNRLRTGSDRRPFSSHLPPPPSVLLSSLLLLLVGLGLRYTRSDHQMMSVDMAVSKKNQFLSMAMPILWLSGKDACILSPLVLQGSTTAHRRGTDFCLMVYLPVQRR